MPAFPFVLRSGKVGTSCKGMGMVALETIIVAVCIVLLILTLLASIILRRCALKLAQPAEYPDALVNRLVHFFDAYGKAHKAYLGEVTERFQKSQPYLVVGIEMDAQIEDVSEMLLSIAKETVPPEKTVEFHRIGSDPVSKYLVNETTPFYLREETTAVS